MRLYISADLEGVSGVVNRDQLGRQGHDYDQGRRLMTGEVNAVCQAAFEAGVDEVIVNDAHSDGRNILIEELHRDARLLTGSPKVLGMMEALDHSFDAVAFVGYHARAGSPGVLNHTISGGSVQGIHLNAKPMGEAGLNAALAGHFGVPVIFLSGDDLACREIEDLVPGVVAVPVKEPRGRYSALCLTPTKARERIAVGVQEALARLSKGDIESLAVTRPVVCRLEVTNTAQLERSAGLPGLNFPDGRTVEFTCDDMEEAYRRLNTIIRLS